MSQLPPASRPASRSSPDGQRITLPPVQLRDDSQQGARQGEGHRLEHLEGRGLPPQPLQFQPSPQHGRPLQPAPSEEDWRSAPSRDLGVHSMLNPTEPEGTPSSGRRVSRGETDSPLSAVGPSSQFGASPSMATQQMFSVQLPPGSTPPTQPAYSATFPRSRTILTPRSPRSVSMGRGRTQGTIDAARSPFLTGRGRIYTADPGQSASSDVPPMPTPPGQTHGQQSYGFPPPASTPRRASSSIMQAPGHPPHSQSASPSISQSSQNPSSSQTSPASFIYKGGPPPTSQGYFPGSTFAQSGGGLQFQAPSGSSSTTEGPYSALPPTQPGSSTVSTSSRQTSASDPIQVLTITTSQGIYNVPVDVHQASRLADEKRARNAGASARFRQRRKEKEKEASTTIEKMQAQTRELERKIREVEQERDFYRVERDRFRDVVFRTPGMRHLAMQAPPSPPSMRAGSFQGSMTPAGGPPPPPTMGFQQEQPQERAPRRRRTDVTGEFTSVAYALPPASTLPPVQAPGYPGQTSLPPLRIDNTAAPQPPQTTGTNIMPTTTAGPPALFDPYARGPLERGWPAEGGRR